MDELVFWIIVYGDFAHGISTVSPTQQALSQFRGGVSAAVDIFPPLQADSIDVSESVHAEPVLEVKESPAVAD